MSAPIDEEFFEDIEDIETRPGVDRHSFIDSVVNEQPEFRTEEPPEIPPLEEEPLDQMPEEDKLEIEDPADHEYWSWEFKKLGRAGISHSS